MESPELLSGIFSQWLMAGCDEVRDRLGFVSQLVLTQGVILGLWGSASLFQHSDCCHASSLQPPLQLPARCEHQGPDDPRPSQPRRLCSAQRRQSGLKATDKKWLYLQVSPLLSQSSRTRQAFFLGVFIWVLLTGQEMLVSLLLRACACWSFSYGSEGLASLPRYLVPVVSSRRVDLCPLCRSIVGSEASIICAWSAVSQVVLSPPSPDQN